MTGLTNREVKDKFEFDPENPSVGINSMIEYLMTAYSDITKVKTNYIDDTLLEYVNDLPPEAAAVIQYNFGIDPTNNLFGDWKENKDSEPARTSLNGLTQSYIQELKTVDGFDEYATYVNLFTNFMREAPNSIDYINDQYDVIAGDPLELDENDLIFVVDKDTTLTDITLAEMGVFNHDEFLNIAIRAIDVQKIKNNDELDDKTKEEEIAKIVEDTYYTPEFKYDELLERTYTYYPHDVIYSDAEPIVTDRVVANLICPSPLSMLEIEYDSFGDKFVCSFRDSETSYIESLLSPYKFNMSRTSPVPSTTDVLEKTIGSWEGTFVNTKNETLTFTLEVPNTAPYVAHLSINGGAPRNMYDPNKMTETYPFFPYPVFGYETFKGYSYNAEVQPSYGEGTEMKVKSILRLKEDKQFGCLSSGIYYSKKFADKYLKDTKDAKITKALMDYIGSESEKSEAFNAYVQFEYKDHRKKDESGNPLTQTTCASALNGSETLSIADIFSTFMGSNNISLDMVHLRSVAGIKTNLAYAEGSDQIDKENTTFSSVPQSINIYPESFEAKDIVTSHLDKWNDEGSLPVEINGEIVNVAKEDRPELTYTDTIELIVALIDTFINAITIALVVFTSLSLVVSCFMIAVVTYISVVERIKEIGVIRSLGGRKRDVAGLFIMETMMTGLFSGVFGITITYILEVIINIIIKAKFGLAIMNLTIPTALLMIGISITLSVLSGLIPSQSAAHKDPVVALRSNE